MVRTWARTVASERLTATATDELDLAHTHLLALVAAANALVAACAHDPDRADCAEAGCRLAGREQGPRLCQLAQRLATLDLDAAPGDAPAAAGRAGVDGALTDFRLALIESLDAVRTCRSVHHAEGRCWFTPGIGADGCGEVLRAAHLAG